MPICTVYFKPRFKLSILNSLKGIMHKLLFCFIILKYSLYVGIAFLPATLLQLLYSSRLYLFLIFRDIGTRELKSNQQIFKTSFSGLTLQIANRSLLILTSNMFLLSSSNIQITSTILSRW